MSICWFSVFCFYEFRLIIRVTKIVIPLQSCSVSTILLIYVEYLQVFYTKNSVHEYHMESQRRYFSVIYVTIFHLLNFFK